MRYDDAVLALILVALAGVAWYFVSRVARRWMREQYLREAMLDVFAAAPGSVEATGIACDWVALKLCGFPTDSVLRTMPPEAVARVIEVTEELKSVCRRLVDQGYLDWFHVSFESRGKDQKISPAGFNAASRPLSSLFVLTSRGQAEVLRRRVAIKKTGG